MTKQEKAELQPLGVKLEAFRLQLEEVQTALKAIRDAAQKQYDNASPQWRDTDFGDDAASDLEEMEKATDALAKAVDHIDDATGCINYVCE